MNKSVLFFQILLLTTLSMGLADDTTSSRGSDYMWNEKQARIIGGTYVYDEDRYPYFGYMRGKGGSCGAVLISKRFVLTAAHCVGNDDDFEFGMTSTSQHPKDYDYRRYKIHPYYDSASFKAADKMGYDIALYELKKEIDDVPYIHLRQSPVTAWGRPMTVIGFGDTVAAVEEERLSDTLKETTIGYVPNDVCLDHVCTVDAGNGNWHSNKDNCIAKPYVTSDMLCGYEQGTHSCQGDSGGPLILKGSNPMEDSLVGLVSWGLACDQDAPWMYARISEFYNWIVTSMCLMNPDGAPYYVDCDDVLYWYDYFN